MSAPGDPPSLWNRAAYMAANDVNTVAVYRLGLGFMVTVMIGMMGYFGSQALSDLRLVRDDMATVKTNVAVQNARLDFDDNRLVALERTGTRQ